MKTSGVSILNTYHKGQLQTSSTLLLANVARLLRTEPTGWLKSVVKVVRLVSNTVLLECEQSVDIKRLIVVASLLNPSDTKVEPRRIATITAGRFPEQIKNYIGDVDKHRVKILVDTDGFYIVMNGNLTGVRYAF